MEAIQESSPMFDPMNLTTPGSPALKTLKERQQERREAHFAAMHKALLDAISTTCASLLRNHTERLHKQNELFLERMRNI